MMQRNLILHPVFLVSLFTLLLNDFYLKQVFSNQLTGKLSDCTGLIVFPIFIAYLVPNSKRSISIITGILFIIWKTPLVSPLIEFTNQHSRFEIQRIIDYSDYWALFTLPLAHRIVNQDFKITFRYRPILILSKVGIT